MVRPKDKFWDHVELIGQNRYKYNYCAFSFSGSVTRVKAHLACMTGHDVQVCSKVPDHIQAEAHADLTLASSTKRKGSSTIGESEIGSCAHGTRIQQPTMVDIVAKKDKKSLEKRIGEFVVKNNIAFNVIQTESFIEMIKAACDFGKGFVVPSYSTLRQRLIPEQKAEVMEYVSNIKSTWGTTGCTIMSDSWTDLKKRAWVNVIAYSPGGAVFLKCIDCGANKITSGYLFKEISTVIEMLGPQNVVQFISDNGANYVSCGDMLTGRWRHMYRTSCAARGVNLFLKDIHKHVRWVRDIIDEGKHVVDYMHKHTALIALMRNFTNDKELKQPCKTRFGTHFLMLQSLVTIENELRVLVASCDWRILQYNRNEPGLKTMAIIQSDDFWKGANEVIAFMEPFIRILRLVDSDGSTAGYLFEATIRAKESLRKLMETDGLKYLPIMDLFDGRLEKNIIHHVHVLAAALNPASVYDGRPNIDSQRLLSAQEFIVDAMVPLEEHDQFAAEMVEFRLKSDKVFNITGKSLMRTNHPRIWWEFIGVQLPVLRNVAIRILSQPCSSSPCERNWSAWEAAQTKKRNRLKPEMLEDLVYIRMNSLMKEKYESLALKDALPIDLEKLGELPEDDVDLEAEILEQTYVEPDPLSIGIDGGTSSTSLSQY